MFKVMKTISLSIYREKITTQGLAYDPSSVLWRQCGIGIRVPDWGGDREIQVQISIQA